MTTYHKRTVRIFFLLMIGIMPVYTQSSLFEAVSDARLVALGFGLNGGMADGYSLRSPSSYFPTRNLTEVSYGSRPLNWIQGLDARLWHTSVTVPVDQLQSFALFYHRLDWGTVNVTSAQSPELIGTAEPYESVLGGAYHRELIDGLSLGIAFKYYYLGINTFGSLNQGMLNAKAYMGDLGISYSHDLFNSEALRGSLFLTTSITNLGTWIKGSDGFVEQVPRSIQFGVAYSQEIFNSSRWQRFTGLIAFQYRGVLNNIYRDSRDYWNLGTELGYADIIFLRAGISVLPFSSIFGNKGQGAASYGFGINVPMGELSSPLSSFSLKFDYAAVPMDTEIVSGLFGVKDIRHNKVYTVHLGYDFSLSDAF